MAMAHLSGATVRQPLWPGLLPRRAAQQGVHLGALHPALAARAAGGPPGASAMPPAPWQQLARLAAAPLLLQRARCEAAAAGGGAGPAGAPLGGQQLALLRVAGDGACMFRSLAQGAHLAQQAEQAQQAGQAAPPRPLPPAEEGAAAAAVRGAVCDELAAREGEIGAFIDGDFSAYVARMRRPATWGGEPELGVAPHVLRRPVAVYSQRSRGPVELVSRYGEGQYSAAEVPLFFHGGGHYDLLVVGAQAGGGPRPKL